MLDYHSPTGETGNLIVLKAGGARKVKKKLSQRKSSQEEWWVRPTLKSHLDSLCQSAFHSVSLGCWLCASQSCISPSLSLLFEIFFQKYFHQNHNYNDYFFLFLNTSRVFLLIGECFKIHSTFVNKCFKSVCLQLLMMMSTPSILTRCPRHHVLDVNPFSLAPSLVFFPPSLGERTVSSCRSIDTSQFVCSP